MKQKGFAVIYVFVGILVLIAVSTGVYYFGKFQPPNAQTQNTAVTIQPTPAITSVPEPPVWKIYKDPQDRFLIKYRDDWQFQTKVSILRKDSNLILKEWLTTQDIGESQDRLCKNCFKVISEKGVVIEGRDGIFREVISHPAGKELRAYISINNNEVLYIYYIQGPEYIEKSLPQEKLEIFNQILSTFKFLPATANEDQKQDRTVNLLQISYHGGMCPDGGCSSVRTILKDGSFLVDDKLKTKIPDKDINELKNLVDSADFEAIKAVKFTGLCPTAYDGQEVTYVFYTAKGQETIASCQIKIDSKSPLFSKIHDILSKII